jgi:hypothetical protein
MTLEELFLRFKSSEDARGFMNAHLKELHKKGLDGKFYKLYCRNYLNDRDMSPRDVAIDELNSPLKGGEIK